MKRVIQTALLSLIFATAVADETTDASGDASTEAAIEESNVVTTTEEAVTDETEDSAYDARTDPYNAANYRIVIPYD